MKAKKVAFLGLSITLAMILSFVESQIPAFTTIPGMKIGLPNLVTVFLLYRVGWKETVVVSIIRVALVALLFGNLQSLLFSLAGAAVSLAGMILLKKTGLFSPSPSALQAASCTTSVRSPPPACGPKPSRSPITCPSSSSAASAPASSSA